MVRAKFWVTNVNHAHTGPGNIFAEVKMAPVYSGQDGNPANAEWSKATPQGAISLSITNPEAIEQFELGKSYWIDISPADGAK